MKKNISLLLCLLMILSTFTGCSTNTQTSSQEDTLFKAGTYEGTAKGLYGDVTAIVEVSNDNIISINFKDHKETPGISDPAFDKLPNQIIENTSIAIDTIAGCTYSSQGILDAVESLHAGASVIIIDKMSSVGGNTIVAGSAMNAAEPEKQKTQTMDAERLDTIENLLALDPVDEYMERWQNNISKDIAEYRANGETYLYDSNDFHKLQTYVGGDYVGNPALIEFLCDNALDSVYWLKKLGTIWKEEIVSVYGSTWTRGHNPSSDMGIYGVGFVLPQKNEVEELGGEILLGYDAEKLIMKDGRVAGVTGVTTDGVEFTLNANKSVVLATGGFAANVEMREEYNTKWASLLDLKTTNPSSSTGDGIVMAKEVGANLVGMEWIQLIPYSTDAITASIDGAIFLNVDGKRFVAEDERRDVVAAETLKQPEQRIFSLVDRDTIIGQLNGVSITGKDIATEYDNGTTAFYGETLEEIASKSGIPLETIQTTLDEYNSYVDSGVDPLGRKNMPLKVDEGPFAMYSVEIMVHHTMGGVEINDDCEVLNSNGDAIAGLYAAGEVTGGIHGSNRLGGNAIADIVTFGRIAGRNAATK